MVFFFKRDNHEILAIYRLVSHHLVHVFKDYCKFVFVAISSMILFTIESPCFLWVTKVITTLCPKNPSHNYLVKKKTFYCWWQPEIRQAPVEGTVVYIPLFKQGFIDTSQGGCLGFLPPMLYQQQQQQQKSHFKQPTRVGRSSLLDLQHLIFRRIPRIGRTFHNNTFGFSSLTRMQKSNDPVLFIVDTSWIIGVILFWIGEPFMYWTVKQNSFLDPPTCSIESIGIFLPLLHPWIIHPHRIHGTAIFTYMNTIQINHSCRDQYTSPRDPMGSMKKSLPFVTSPSRRRGRKQRREELEELQFKSLAGDLTNDERCSQRCLWEKAVCFFTKKKSIYLPPKKWVKVFHIISYNNI